MSTELTGKPKEKERVMTLSSTEAILALIAKWRSLQHKQATEGDGTPIHVGAFHAYKRCADELDALLDAQGLTLGVVDRRVGLTGATQKIVGEK